MSIIMLRLLMVQGEAKQRDENIMKEKTETKKKEHFGIEMDSFGE